jgi:hypothetical protein
MDRPLIRLIEQGNRWEIPLSGVPIGVGIERAQVTLFVGSGRVKDLVITFSEPGLLLRHGKEHAFDPRSPRYEAMAPLVGLLDTTLEVVAASKRDSLLLLTFTDGSELRVERSPEGWESWEIHGPKNAFTLIGAWGEPIVFANRRQK